MSRPRRLCIWPSILQEELAGGSLHSLLWDPVLRLTNSCCLPRLAILETPGKVGFGFGQTCIVWASWRVPRASPGLGGARGALQPFLRPVSSSRPRRCPELVLARMVPAVLCLVLCGQAVFLQVPLLRESDQACELSRGLLPFGRLSRVGLYAARQAPPSMGFSRQEYWSGFHFLLQGIFPTQGWNPRLQRLLD